MKGLDNLYNDYNDEIIKLYGIGVSNIQSKALSVTFHRLLSITHAIFYEEIEDDYFVYVYYLNYQSCLLAYKLFSQNFAIVSSVIYEREMSIQDLANDLLDDYLGDD